MRCPRKRGKLRWTPQPCSPARDGSPSWTGVPWEQNICEGTSPRLRGRFPHLTGVTPNGLRFRRRSAKDACTGSGHFAVGRQPSRRRLRLSTETHWRQAPELQNHGRRAPRAEFASSTALLMSMSVGAHIGMRASTFRRRPSSRCRKGSIPGPKRFTDGWTLKPRA